MDNLCTLFISLPWCRCRVDFTTSQTRTERLQLRVVVRPSRPQIIDDGGTVLDLYAGPYRSGKIFFEF